MACVLALAVAYAAEQAATAKQAEPKYTEVKYWADSSSYRWDGEDRILALKGNVKFVQEDTVLIADKIDYRESTRTANASGNLKIYDEQNSITGDTCLVNFKEKRGTLTGNVRMVAKPKPKPEASGGSSKPKSLKSEWKDEAVLTCDKIDYFYKEKRAVIASPVTIVQKDRTVTADSATYLGKDEIVQLVGNVKGKDEKERHSFSAPKVTVSLKADDEWIEAEKATGSFYVKEEEEEAKPAKSEVESSQPKVQTQP
jgi:lipopolysaccharide assembly outer membrane protein LptD (OstA)